MSKIFEDEFMEWQADMVDIAKEYIENRAEKIYLYGSIENRVYSFNLFFQIKGKIVFMSQVNTVLNSNDKQYDISPDRRQTVLHIGTEDLQEIKKVCDKYGQPTPTQFKLFYDVQKNSLKAKYEYDLMYSDMEDFDTDDIFMEWYEEIKKEVEG